MIPRALEDIFALSADEGNQPDIAVSFVEIYNEKVYDLLAEDTNEQVNIKGKFQFKVVLGRLIEWLLLVNEIASTASINFGNKRNDNSSWPFVLFSGCSVHLE